MNQQNKNQYSPLYPLLTVVICIGIAYLAISPLIGELKEININTKAKNIEISEMEKKVNDLKYLSKEFSESQEEIAKLKASLPKEKKIDEFIVQIVNMVNNAGLSISSIRPVSKKELPNKIIIDVNVSGNYENLLLLMDYLENNARLVNVYAINISKANSEELTGVVDAKITLGIIEVDFGGEEELAKE